MRMLLLGSVLCARGQKLEPLVLFGERKKEGVCVCMFVYVCGVWVGGVGVGGGGN